MRIFEIHSHHQRVGKIRRATDILFHFFLRADLELRVLVLVLRLDLLQLFNQHLLEGLKGDPVHFRNELTGLDVYSDLVLVHLLSQEVRALRLEVRVVLALKRYGIVERNRVRDETAETLVRVDDGATDAVLVREAMTERDTLVVGEVTGLLGGDRGKIGRASCRERV